MKTNRMKCSTSLFAAAIIITAGSANAAVTVAFSGGAGTPLSFTLPAITWEITNVTYFNGGLLGIGIAVNQTPADTGSAGGSLGGNVADWSTNSALLAFPRANTGTFSINNNASGPNAGGIVWLGIEINNKAVIGDKVTFSGGTLSNSAAVTESFVSGNYEVYLLSPYDKRAVSTAGVLAIPEPSSALLGGIGSLLLFRRRRA